ncbi:hypothetical protein DV736_g4719, partial [Chaetothyriales sp. CBS 134916]
MSIDISGSAINSFLSEERLELLNDIDRFRQHGLENLPQIVVCGDTSSGKSSVLEALLGVPFPVDSTICTRFATAIALRYTSLEGVTGEASITPSPKATESHRARVQSFHHRIESLESIPAIMQEAKGLMGVGDDCGISEDVLDLRLHGRNLPNLTLVDLPGLIHASKNTEDIGRVQRLVEQYFKQENSIILTIVSSENPIDSQGILTFSRKFDTTGNRSIGVITKPDLLSRPDKARLLPTILELAENRNSAFKFRRPWHIVRCLNDDERQKGNGRAVLERELLGRQPWDQFPRSQRGIQSLRSRLCEYLQEHIGQVLPELADSLQKKVSSIKSSLEELGPPRATSADRMQYLIRISKRYDQLVNDALDGTYTDPFFNGENSQNRLRAITMGLADDFEDTMRTRGHAYEISEKLFFFQSKQPTQPQWITQVDALNKIGKLVESHRGPELPFLFNPRIVGEFFKEQSANWPLLVSAYTAQVCQVVRVFIRKVVKSVSPSDGKTADLLLRHIFDDAVHKRQEDLDNKVQELITPLRGPFFFSTKRRLQASLKIIEGQDENEPTRALQVQQKTTVTNAVSSEHDNRLKLLQFSRAFYNVALENFIDNVVVLGVESCLLSKVGEMFSPETIAGMDDRMLQLLGGESPDTSAERDDLQAQLTKLKASLKACRRHISQFGLGFAKLSENFQETKLSSGTVIESRKMAIPSSQPTEQWKLFFPPPQTKQSAPSAMRADVFGNPDQLKQITPTKLEEGGPGVSAPFQSSKKLSGSQYLLPEVGGTPSSTGDVQDFSVKVGELNAPKKQS